MLVVDASAIVEALLESPPNPALSLLSTNERLHAPTLIDYEVASALRGPALRGRIDETRVQRLVGQFENLSIERHSLDKSLLAILGLRHNFTVYDAAYVVLAKALRAPLVTADSKMLDAEKLGVEVHVFE